MDVRTFSQLLDEHLTEPLEGERLAAFEQALRENEEFRREFEAQSALLVLLSEPEPVALPDGMHENIMAAVKRERLAAVEARIGTERRKAGGLRAFVAAWRRSRWQVQSALAVCCLGAVVVAVVRIAPFGESTALQSRPRVHQDFRSIANELESYTIDSSALNGGKALREKVVTASGMDRNAEPSGKSGESEKQWFADMPTPQAAAMPAATPLATAAPAAAAMPAAAPALTARPTPPAFTRPPAPKEIAGARASREPASEKPRLAAAAEVAPASTSVIRASGLSANGPTPADSQATVLTGSSSERKDLKLAIPSPTRIVVAEETESQAKMGAPTAMPEMAPPMTTQVRDRGRDIPVTVTNGDIAYFSLGKNADAPTTSRTLALVAEDAAKQGAPPSATPAPPQAPAATITLHVATRAGSAMPLTPGEVLTYLKNQGVDVRQSTGGALLCTAPAGRNLAWMLRQVEGLGVTDRQEYAVASRTASKKPAAQPPAAPVKPAAAPAAKADAPKADMPKAEQILPAAAAPPVAASGNAIHPADVAARGSASNARPRGYYTVTSPGQPATGGDATSLLVKIDFSTAE